MSNYPPSGGGGNWKDLGATYCSPSGNDNNDGSSWSSPKKTIYAAIVALYANSPGGTVYISQGCEAGGPVSGQGIRLRADQLNHDNFFYDKAPGFLHIEGPIRLQGVGGNGEGLPGFYMPPAATRFKGGGDSTFNPPLWIVGFTGMHGVEINGLENFDHGVMGARVGVDFERISTGALKDVTVANATRVGENTVLTLTLGDALTVTKAARTSNVTTLTIPNPGLPFPPFHPTVPVVFTSGDVDFPSGAYVITTMRSWRDTNDANYEWQISFADPGADVPEKTISASSVKTHGCSADDLIEFTSTSIHFQSTQYYVNSVSADGLTVSVTDVFGDGNANVNNAGHINRQERFYGGTTNFQMRNSAFIVQPADVNSHNGLDMGNTMAMWPQVYNCNFTGCVGNGETNRDERRMAAVFVYGGGVNDLGPPVAALYITDSCSSSGGIYLQASITGILNCEHYITDTFHPELPIPSVRVDGTLFTRVYCDDVAGADSGGSTYNVVLNNVPDAGARIYRSGPVSGACIGGESAQVPQEWLASPASPNPWVLSHYQIWGSGRISARHPGPARAMGVLGARYSNLLLTPANWGLNGASRTLGQPAPDGSATAAKITSVGTYVHMLPTATLTGPIEVGGKFIICGWVNVADSSAYIYTDLFRIDSASLTFDFGPHLGLDYLGTGWQFVYGVRKVTACSDSTPDVQIDTLGTSGWDINYWGMTAFYVPASVSDNDAYELAGTCRHQPVYLPGGMSGTMENGKLIGHGGLGTGTAYVEGVAAGQLTIVGSFTPKKYEPILKADGTIKGWIELIDATINP